MTASVEKKAKPVKEKKPAKPKAVQEVTAIQEPITETQPQSQVIEQEKETTMNTATATNNEELTTRVTRGQTEYAIVTMDDGRKVEFAGKRKMLKDTIILEDGTVQVRLDFVNGETRLFTVPENLLLKFAGHGAEQKLGDEISGVSDVEDCVLAVDELTERLNNGDWGVVRTASNSIAGTSILARALVEHSGKPMEVIKEFLRDKTQAQKMALRNNPSIQPIIAKLEAAKVRKEKVGIDTEAMLAGL